MDEKTENIYSDKKDKIPQENKNVGIIKTKITTLKTNRKWISQNKLLIFHNNVMHFFKKKKNRYIYFI